MASGTRWHRGLLALIFVVYSGMSLAFNVLQPMGEGPDEPAHLEFVQYIQQNRTLPTNLSSATSDPEPLAPGIEFDQVPLYYVVLAATLSPIWLPPGAKLHRDPYLSWPGHPWQRAYNLHWIDEGWPYHGLSLFVHAGRLFSVLLGFVTLFALYWLVRRIAGPSEALFAVAWLAWGPGFLLTSSHLNNDAAATAASALVLVLSTYLLTANRPSNLAFAGIGVALSIALLSKIHTLFLVPIVVVAVASRVPRSRARFRTVVRRVVVTAAVLTPASVLLGAWWLAVGHTFDRRLNSAVGFGVTVLGARLSEIDWRRLPQAFWWFNSTWWGGMGDSIATFWQPAVYAFLAATVVVLIVAGIHDVGRGVIQDWRRGRIFRPLQVGEGRRALATRWNSLTPERRAACLLGLGAIPLIYATITRQVFPWVDLDANARFVLPAAPTIALFVTIGGLALPLGRARVPLAIGYVFGILGLSVATAAFLLPQMNAPRIPARLARSPAEASSPPLAAFTSGVELIGVDNVPPSLSVGTPMHLTLRWRVAQTPPADFIVFTHLVGGDGAGTASSGHDEVPYERYFPPTLWQSGEIVAQNQDLAPLGDLAPGLYSLRVGMYRLQADKIAPIPLIDSAGVGDSVVVANWKVLPPVVPGETRHQIEARFGDDLVLRGQSLSDEPDGVHVTLIWQALRTPTRHLVVSAQVLDTSGKLIAQHDGEPVDGRLPTTSWDTGDLVQDTHVVGGVSAPRDLAVIVAVYDRDSQRRLPVSESGRADADHVTLDW